MNIAQMREEALFDRYRAHHEMGRPLLEWMGVLGCIAFPLLYVVRNLTTNTGFDDLWLRLLAIVLCFGLALRKSWPKALKSYYILYSWWAVFYCLSFLLAYTMLRNGGGTPFVVNMVMGAVLIVLLADWRNTVLMLALGWAAALSFYLGVDAGRTVPTDFMFAVAGSLLLVTGGALSQKGQQRVELERMRRLYAGLAGAIAHEMRTPLAQIQHVLRCIDAEVPPGSAAARAVQQGHSAIHRGLQSIAITLQQISARNPTQTELRTLSAEHCVRKALDDYAYDSPQASNHVRLHVEEDFQFRGNTTALELVLFNLLKNSLYYLPLHPHMEVSITVMVTPTPSIVVHDTGPGVAPDVVPRLFEEFQTHGKADGTGLGLAFCRRTLREWGGDIQCRSEKGRFTEFTMSFVAVPAASPAWPATVPPALAHRSLAGRTVLIVDDQRFNRTVARALVSDLGLNTLEAEHGQQALDMLQQGTVPDVVLMDVNMPGLDGMATARLLRDIPGVAGLVPVFALTANDSRAVREAAREAGMQGVLAKPIDVQALKRALATVL